jgi:hypothetical protein
MVCDVMSSEFALYVGLFVGFIVGSMISTVICEQRQKKKWRRK